MPATLELKIFSPAGTLRAVVTDFQNLECEAAVNRAGWLRCRLRANHTSVSAVELGGLVELWRSDPERGISPGRLLGGPIVARRWSFLERGFFDLWAESWLGLLSRRVVAYKAEVVNRSLFNAMPGETIMKSMVEYNAGPNAVTAAGRLRDGVIPGLTVEPTQSRGPSLTWRPFMDNLLTSLTRLALLAGGDFDLVRTAAAAWQFRYYPGQLGADRSAGVRFALPFGNMGGPDYLEDRRQTFTAAVVGGREIAENRRYVVQTLAGYVSPEDREMFLNAAAMEVDPGLQAAGSQALEKKKPRPSFHFAPLQTPYCLFGRHYFLGDKVSAMNPFTEAWQTMKVDQLNLSLDASGQETLSLNVIS